VADVLKVLGYVSCLIASTTKNCSSPVRFSLERGVLVACIFWVSVFVLSAVLIALTLAADEAGAAVAERQAGAGREGVGHAGGRDHRDLRHAGGDEQPVPGKCGGVLCDVVSAVGILWFVVPANITRLDLV
jgi:hypothetical protein